MTNDNTTTNQKVHKTPIYTRKANAAWYQRQKADPEKYQKHLEEKRKYMKERYAKIKAKKEEERIKNLQLIPIEN